MLVSYQQRTRLLLNDAGFARFNDFDLASYINTARGQIAGEGECIRVYAGLSLVAGTQQYPFSSINFPAGTLGIEGVINVRMISYAIQSGQVIVAPREWEWFNQYIMNNPVPDSGAPRFWAQFGQGAGGTLFLNIPDLPYVLSLDTVCFPLPLATDADAEALPYLWTDAVPYFSAYLAMLTAENADGATNMLKLYQMFMARARAFATPSVLPGQYAQGPDPMMANRLAVQPARTAG